MTSPLSFGLVCGRDHCLKRNGGNHYGKRECTTLLMIGQCAPVGQGELLPAWASLSLGRRLLLILTLEGLAMSKTYLVAKTSAESETGFQPDKGTVQRTHR